ncbi:MAG: acyl-CoA dehydrogenase [Deltaproteobacteria bacterium]|jgi:citronellyl-CoA dehydrogenase|nr:acyl-CoA dehydrogenase [Deltaproteobacteria bacterium]
MSSDLYSTPEHEAFRDTVRRFTEDELRPRARDFDAAGRIDKSLFKKMGDLGMLGLRYDPAYGGAGLDWSFSAVMHEELGRSDNAGATLAISVHTEMATPSLAQFGSQELKRDFLAPAITGETVSAIAVTEPDAGSDVSAIQTRAVRDGEDWIINGSKIYITNAANADWLCLLAVTDPEAGYSGFSQIIVPTDLAGLRYDLLDKIGLWGSDTGQFFFEDLRVPVAHTIGEIGRGFQQQMMQFQHERLVACISQLGASELLWEETKKWTQERVLFGKPLSKMQNTQFKMAHLWTQITAARALNDACVRSLVAGEEATTMITMAKLFSCNAALEVATECLQLHGGYGLMKESMAGRAFVDTRVGTIGGGSDETMLHYLAKQLGF